MHFGVEKNLIEGVNFPAKMTQIGFASLLLLATIANAYVVSVSEDAGGDMDVASNSSCVHGRLSEDETCSCNPCWEGSNCDDYVDFYSPRFLVHKATAVVPTNVSGNGAVYRAWSSDEDLGLTCPLGPGESTRCPCASVRYQLFSPPGDHHFNLNPDTGILSRSQPPPGELQQGATYTYKLMVQSTPVEGYTQDLLYDILDLEIFVGSPFIRKIPWT